MNSCYDGGICQDKCLPSNPCQQCGGIGCDACLGCGLPCQPGPTGPTGPTGPAGPSRVAAYGTRYGGGTTLFATIRVPNALPLPTTGPSQNVTYGSNSDIIVGLDGDYLIEYYAVLSRVDPAQGFDYLLTRNGNAVTETQGLATYSYATYPETFLLSAHAILTLNAGDAIAFAVYTIITGTYFALSERVDARLSLVRL